MILEEETYEKFEYYPSDLKPQSNKKVLAMCDECGKVRAIPRELYRFLCYPCARKKQSGEDSPNWKGGKIKRICKYCKRIFEVGAGKIKAGGGKFCSRECYARWMSNNKRGKNSPSWKGGLVTRICEICGKEFEVKRGASKTGRGRFCSQSCSRKGKKIPTHHTKPEMIFEAICKKYDFPFKYTGDGSFWIGKDPSVNPDFVECNGKKIAVEIFSYWHDSLRRFGKVRYIATYEGRKKILKKYGWKLVVFWQEDLERKDAEQFVLFKLQKEGITI